MDGQFLIAQSLSGVDPPQSAVESAQGQDGSHSNGQMATLPSAPKDLTGWLNDLGLGKYHDAFLANDVDLRALPHLTDTDLRELGVSLGHRRIMLAAITALSAAPVPATRPLSGGAAQGPAATDHGERRLGSVDIHRHALARSESMSMVCIGKRV